MLQPTGQVILTLSDHPRGETRDQEIRAVVWQQATQVCNQQDLSFRLLGDEFLQQAWEFYSFAKTPRSNCLLNIDKLASVGLPMRPVREALREALENWMPAQALELTKAVKLNKRLGFGRKPLSGLQSKLN